jgi:hypothetical protein
MADVKESAESFVVSLRLVYWRCRETTSVLFA